MLALGKDDPSSSLPAQDPYAAAEAGAEPVKRRSSKSSSKSGSSKKSSKKALLGAGAGGGDGSQPPSATAKPRRRIWCYLFIALIIVVVIALGVFIGAASSRPSLTRPGSALHRLTSRRPFPCSRQGCQRQEGDVRGSERVCRGGRRREQRGRNGRTLVRLCNDDRRTRLERRQQQLCLGLCGRLAPRRELGDDQRRPLPFGVGYHDRRTRHGHGGDYQLERRSLPLRNR